MEIKVYLCIIKQVKTQVSPTNKLKTNMAKVGYIFLAEAYESVESDKAWMEKFGCVKIVEENAEDEKLRPEWKALLMSLERGDELVLSKFSNALRGTRELSYFLELCRIKVIRIISIHTEEYLKILLITLDKCSLKHVLNMTRYSI